MRLPEFILEMKAAAEFLDGTYRIDCRVYLDSDGVITRNDHYAADVNFLIEAPEKAEKQ